MESRLALGLKQCVLALVSFKGLEQAEDGEICKDRMNRHETCGSMDLRLESLSFWNLVGAASTVMI